MVKRILGIVARVLGGLLGVATAAAALGSAYVVFAPDTLPKPFYLEYRTLPSGAEEAAASEGGEGTPTAEPGVVGQILGALGMGGEGDSAAEAAAETPAPVDPASLSPGQGFMLNTGTKIVNLADPGGRRFLKVTVVLEFAESAAHDPSLSEEEHAAEVTAFNDALNARLPVINDALTTLLSSKTFETIYTIEGKESLRAEIMEAVNGRMPDYHVIYVYFTEFVVE